VGAGLGAAANATGTIQDDDAPPQISISDCAADEGALCGFGLTLSQVSGKTVTVNYATASGSATSGTDFVPASGVAVFTPGSPAVAINVQAIDDTIDEIDEAFVVNLTAPGNATLADAQGTGFINDDDGPRISVGNFAVIEGTSGPTPLDIPVSLSAVSPQEVRVGFFTSDGTATAGSDYVAATGTVTFTPGQTLRNVPVSVMGDTVDEPDERFYLNLQNPVDGTIGVLAGQGTILDDDGATLRLAELGHGSDVRGSFAGGADLYLVQVPARSSWQVVLDEASGDASNGGPALQRVANDLTTVVQNSVAVGVAGARTLSWRNDNDLAQAAYVRVASTQCGTDCGADDTYRVRGYETTLRSPRFNNAGSQITVLVLQNAGTQTITGTFTLWPVSGSVAGAVAQAFTLGPHASQAFNTSVQPPGGAGQSGSVTVVHDGDYGALVGKTVALEPSTGFSFDAPLSPRPH
jgi:hypothetical protein